MAEGFLLGPGLLSQVRRTIDRVDGEAIGSGVRTIPTVLEGEDALPTAKLFRVCTFTGAWPINSTKTVQLAANGQTVNAVNLTFPLLTVDPNARITCGIARDGTAWHLVDVAKNQTFGHLFAGQFETRTVITDIQIAATLNTSNCAITVAKTAVTATVTIVLNTYTASFLSLAGMDYYPSQGG